MLVVFLRDRIRIYKLNLSGGNAQGTINTYRHERLRTSTNKMGWVVADSHFYCLRR